MAETAAREGRRAGPPGAAGRRNAGRRRADRSGAARLQRRAGQAGELRSAARAARSRSRTGCRTGAPRRTRSTTGASSTSTRSPGCGSSARRCSPRRTSCSRRCCAKARVDAVRIDHPDGLFDPARYFEMLQELAAQPGTRARGRRPRARSTSSPRRSCRATRRCRARWALHGTTGYNYLNDLNGAVRQRRARPAHAPHLRQADRPHSSRSTTWCTRASG